MLYKNLDFIIFAVCYKYSFLTVAYVKPLIMYGHFRVLISYAPRCMGLNILFECNKLSAGYKCLVTS